MQSSLAVCILAALLATGQIQVGHVLAPSPRACLQCPHCEGDGTSCTGNLRTCPAGQNSCGVVLTEITLAGEKIQTIFKGCATSSQCKAGFVSMNFGKGMMTKMSIACCMTHSCTPEPVK
ncbi:unnamed protein product, partial [Natator depressus]